MSYTFENPPREKTETRIIYPESYGENCDVQEEQKFYHQGTRHTCIERIDLNDGIRSFVIDEKGKSYDCRTITTHTDRESRELEFTPDEILTNSLKGIDKQINALREMMVAACLFTNLYELKAKIEREIDQRAKGESHVSI